jgi:hypothetical protein
LEKEFWVNTEATTAVLFDAAQLAKAARTPSPGAPGAKDSPPPPAPGTCAKCKAPLKPGAKFCTECGTKVGG